jgi:uncharacterized protein (TIGR02147 family)
MKGIGDVLARRHLSWKPDIYEYIDYRAFLRDYYTLAKENVRAFSYRYLARRAGFSSPNFIKLVMEGDRNLGGDSIDKVAQAFDIEGEERDFFKALVAFDQADTVEERNDAFEAIAASRRYKSARRIDYDMFEYLSHWYYPAIREMAARRDFRADAAWVAQQMWPRISEQKAAKALDLLLRLGLLVELEDGSIGRGEPSLTTGHQVTSLAVGNYHRQMLTRAVESIELVDREERDISALTVCINGKSVEELKQRVRAFREVLLEICDTEDDPEVVYQVNFQIFPLTRSPEESS